MGLGQSGGFDPPLAGTVAIVTGASRRNGIGAAVCWALATAGADLFFTTWQANDRMQGLADPDGPAALLADLRGLGIRAEAMEADLSLSETPEAVLAEARARLGPPAILVNNAAYSTRDGYERLDAATLDAHYAVNLRATALLAVGFAQGYDGGEGGRIVNLTSGQDRGPMPGELAYAATKGAIVAFTRTLAAEVGPKGITVNAVNPGPTDTGWMDDELKRELLPRFPLGRLGQPEDAARLIAWLCGPDAGWVTGQLVASEGGFF
ncbi:MAG TPA: SDR family oxidoreductase [Thermomicrobiales bacterium]|nr:SDR family oxidoreductase [Thermomicrobiales bacterium]